MSLLFTCFPTKWIPLTTRPSFISRHGMIFMVPILSPFSNDWVYPLKSLTFNRSFCKDSPPFLRPLFYYTFISQGNLHQRTGIANHCFKEKIVKKGIVSSPFMTTTILILSWKYVCKGMILVLIFHPLSIDVSSSLWSPSLERKWDQW